MEKSIKQNPMRAYDLLEVRGNLIYINGEINHDILYCFEDSKCLPLELRLPALYKSLEIPDYKCPFCKSNLIHEFIEEFSDDWFDNAKKSSQLLYCQYCRFWQWDYYFDNHAYFKEFRRNLNTGLNSPLQTKYISKLREFNTNLPSVCSSELAQFLRINPTKWNIYNPKQFEKLVADIFRANYKDADVMHVGKPDDGGVDILFIDTEKKEWLVQVKRRERINSSEGVSTIRNLLGAMMLGEKLNGIIVSTADHFTLRAKQAAGKIEKQGLFIELIDKGILNRMLDPVLPDRPWLDSIEKIDKEVASLFALRIPSDNQLNLFPNDPFWKIYFNDGIKREPVSESKFFDYSEDNIPF